MKTIKTTLLLSLIAVFIVASLTTCKKPAKETSSTGNLTVQFNPTVGGQAFSTVNTFYSLPNLSQYFYFTDMQMYLSNFSLVKSDNSLLPLDSVVYFEYGASEWMSFTVHNVPAGNYKGIQFSFGLDPSENSANPYAYPDTDALSGIGKNDIYWSWMKYRFISLEGRLDTSATDNYVHGVGLDYHVGTDTCYRTISLSGNSLAVVGGINNNVNLNLEVEKIFYNSTDTLNMYLYPGTQSVDTFPGNDIAVAIKFANQITHAFSYSQQ